MIGIARHTDYAARLVLHLACLGEGAQVSIAEVSEQRQLPAPFVRRLVGKLVRTGILATVRGSGGGIRLARPASEISLLDIVRALEGGVALNHCVDNAKACPFAENCPVQTAWTQATRALEQNLGSVRFDALAHGTSGHVAAHAREPKRNRS